MATEPIDVESIESVLRAVFPDLAGTTGEIFEQVAYEEGTEAAAPSVRRVAMAEGGWPMPSLEMLGQLVGLPGLAAALPGDVGGFTGLNLASVELDDTSGLITVDVVWADGRLPIVPRLFELSEPGVRFVQIGRAHV